MIEILKLVGIAILGYIGITLALMLLTLAVAAVINVLRDMWR